MNHLRLVVIASCVLLTSCYRDVWVVRTPEGAPCADACHAAYDTCCDTSPGAFGGERTCSPQVMGNCRRDEQECLQKCPGAVLESQNRCR